MLHRAGVEFFEVIPFSVCAGLVCLLVFRKLTGEPYGAIWDFEAPITAVDWRHILLGARPRAVPPLAWLWSVSRQRCNGHILDPECSIRTCMMMACNVSAAVSSSISLHVSFTVLISTQQPSWSASFVLNLAQLAAEPKPL